MKCDKCGFENQDGSKFCAQCGSELVKDEIVEPKKNTVKCSICGAINDEGSPYCYVCGTQLAKNNATNTNYSINSGIGGYQMYETNSAADRKAQVGMVLGIISLVTGITCCLFFVSVITGLIGLIYSIIALNKKTNTQGKAIAGLVMSIIGLLIGIYMTFSLIYVLNDPAYMEELRKAIEAAQNGNGYSY